jgi:hypothetical protein
MHRIKYIKLQGNLSEELFASSLLCPSGSPDHPDQLFLPVQSSMKDSLFQPLTGLVGIQTEKYQYTIKI